MDKVLIYTMSDSMGGVEEFVLNLSRYNARNKCEYEYIVLGDKTPYQKEMEELGVKYWFIPPKSSFFRNVKSLTSCFKERRKECGTIYFNTSALIYPIPYLLALLFRYRIVLHSHSTGTNGIRRYIHLFNRNWINKICSARLACSMSAAEWMFGKRASKNKVTLIPNAIDLEKFQFSAEVRCKMRMELGVKDELVVGHVGRLTHVKNQSFLLSILREAQRCGIDCKLLLVGEGEDRDALMAQAEDFGIFERVIFYGQSFNIAPLMSAMDCFVMPSFVEGFPVTVVEAQAAGLPCLLSSNITSEINITGNIKFLPLDAPCSEWMNQIRDMASNRYDGVAILQERGFSVSDLEESVQKAIAYRSTDG